MGGGDCSDALDPGPTLSLTQTRTPNKSEENQQPSMGPTGSPCTDVFIIFIHLKIHRILLFKVFYTMQYKRKK